MAQATKLQNLWSSINKNDPSQVAIYNILVDLANTEGIDISKLITQLAVINPTAGTLAANIIQEITAGSGITVGGVLLKNNIVNSDSVNLLTPLVTTPVGTVTVKEYGDGKDMVTVLTLTNFVVGALAGSAADLGIGNIVGIFPAGQHLELVYSFSTINLKCAGTVVVTKTGLGSVIASGVVSVLSGTSTFQDRLTAQNITTDPAGGTAISALTGATAGIGTGISLNIAASIKSVFLNSAGTWNANNTGNLTASGIIMLKWTKMS